MTLDDELYGQLMEQAENEDRSVSKMMNRILRWYFEQGAPEITNKDL